MKLFPTRRLVVLLAAWLVAAVLGSAWPPLLVPVVGAGVLLLALAAWDGRSLWRRLPPQVARDIPARNVIERAGAISYRLHNPASEAARIEMEDEWSADFGGAAPRAEDVRLAAGETRILEYPIRPKRRGDRPLGNLLLFDVAPMGLIRRRQIIEGDAVLPVYPDAQRLARTAALDPRLLLSQAGIRPQRQRGSGSDFESLRDYVVGDDPRHIDWAATARRGELVTRLYQHERNHTIVLAVDCSRLMGARCSDERTKLDHSIDAALTLSIAALARGDRVEVILFDREIRGHVAPRAHRREVGPLVELLRHAEPTQVEADYPRLVRALLARRRGRALVVMLTDFAEAASADIEAPLRLLRRSYRTLLVALRDPLYGSLRESDAQDKLGPYRRLAVNELLRDRELALTRLRGAAVQSLDLPPEQIVAPLLNRYLEFRYGES